MKTLVDEIRDSLNLLETADIIRWGEQYSANTSPFVERVRKAIRWGVADLQLQRPLAVNLSSANAAAHSKQNHSISVPIFPENYRKIGTSPEFTIFHELAHAKRFEDGDDVTSPKLDEAITQAVADAWNRFYPDRLVDAAELYLRIMTWKRTDQFLRFFTLMRGHKYFAMQPGENLPDDAEAIIGRGPLVDQEWDGKTIADAYNSLLPWEVDANNTAREMEGRYKAENPVSEMRETSDISRTWWVDTEYEDLCGDFIGHGGERDVFQHADRDDVVVKVSHSWTKNTNLMEWTVWEKVNNTFFADYFAPCIELSPEHKFLLQQKTEPIERIATAPLLFVLGDGMQHSNLGMLDSKLVCHDYTSFYHENWTELAKYHEQLAKVMDFNALMNERSALRELGRMQWLEKLR